MSIRRLTTHVLILYFTLTCYAVLSLFTGLGYHPILTPLSTLLAFTFAVLHSSQTLGWKQGLFLLAITFIISLTFESVGVATGWVYGGYHYTDKLGYKFLGLVPLLIPLAWFMMSYPAYLITLRLLPAMRSLWGWRISVAAVGALVMTAWDLAMDPMMVAGEHWVWDQPGAYFGIPIQNYWGWWLTIFISFLLFLWLARVTPVKRLETDTPFERLAIFSYAITGLSTIVVDFRAGLAGPGLVGLFAMLPWVILSWHSHTKPDE
jgi:uncharacterized membrane protein